MFDLQTESLKDQNSFESIAAKSSIAHKFIAVLSDCALFCGGGTLNLENALKNGIQKLNYVIF